MCEARVALSIVEGKDEGVYDLYFKGFTFPVFQLFEQVLNFSLISDISVLNYSASPETTNCMVGNLQITLGKVTMETMKNLKEKLTELFVETLIIMA